MYLFSSQHKGFTLVEVIVAVGLFLIVVTLGTGSFLQALTVKRTSEGLTLGINNFGSVMESMIRAIRTGTSFGAGGSSFTFTDQNGNHPTYTCDLANHRLTETWTVVDQAGGTHSFTNLPITNPSLDITSCSFTVVGQNPYSAADLVQPYVTIHIQGTFNSPKSTVPFNLQTTVEQRQPDY